MSELERIGHASSNPASDGIIVAQVMPTVRAAMDKALREAGKDARAKVMARAREAELSRLYWTGVGRLGDGGSGSRST